VRLLDAQNQLMAQRRSWWTTADAAAMLDITTAHASQLLRRLAEAGSMISLARGRWALRAGLDAFILPEALTAPMPSYLSLHSALFHHGMISQIPSVIYAATLARTRRYDTPAGTVSLHHLDPSFFSGYTIDRASGIAMATAEKALLDLFYLSAIGRGRFKSLPEIELPKTFSAARARKIAASIPSPRLRTLVAQRLDGFLAP
jgi:predicted transcriptional regulator of viral defense system